MHIDWLVCLSTKTSHNRGLYKWCSSR